MRLSIVGTGYVGLTTGVCLAARGHDVTALDVRGDIVDRLNGGEPHIHERDLGELLRRAIAEGRFRARRVEEADLAGSEIVMIAVGTPTVDGRIDLGQIADASRFIGRWLRHAEGDLSVVVKSTVVPGTTDTFVRRHLEAESGKGLGVFGLGMNPEFLREGDAVVDFMEPDRVVLGHEDPRTLARLEELYTPWHCERVRVNTRTAELIKYANNALLATQISAVNELANIAAAIGGIDVMDVMAGVHLDRRWNPVVAGARVDPQILTYLVPGCGFGGSCFPKDLHALRATARDVGADAAMLDAVIAVNARQPSQVSVLLERHLGSLRDRRVLVLGLAFKPGTDDVRESTSLTVIRDLLARGAKVSAHDPVAEGNARAALHDVAVEYVERWDAAVPGAEVIVVATKWPDYARLAEPPLRQALAGKVIVDPRRFLSPAALGACDYLAIGRSPDRPSFLTRPITP
jgi:UDPglucose 6-dehydrogenase/GDP-mannose 6-dehydrogenase